VATLGYTIFRQIKRVRLVKRAEGYSAQFCISVDRIESMPATGTTIGLDVGLKDFYTDSNGAIAPNPCFRSKGEKRCELPSADIKVQRELLTSTGIALT